MRSQIDQVVDRYLLRMSDVFWGYIPANSFNRSIYTIVKYCHTDICQLDLEKLLQSDDSQFMHDMSGILGGDEDKDSQLPLGGFLPYCRVIS